MNREEQISFVLKQLGMSEDADGLVGVLFDALLAEAQTAANRTDTPDALLAIVRDTVIAVYRRRGDEGVSSSSVGGQTYAYDDLHDHMLQRIVRANLRVFRL